MARLPPRVVAELEFNSVIPPPDMIEEAQHLNSQPLLIILHRINSTQSAVIIVEGSMLLVPSLEKRITKLKTR